jgi:hypothetical protein
MYETVCISGSILSHRFCFHAQRMHYSSTYRHPGQWKSGGNTHICSRSASLIGDRNCLCRAHPAIATANDWHTCRRRRYSRETGRGTYLCSNPNSRGSWLCSNSNSRWFYLGSNPNSCGLFF